MTKKLRRVLSVAILVVTGGVFAQVVVAADQFQIHKCVGASWWVDFFWTIDGAPVQFHILDCSNETKKIDITRTGAAEFANDYHFIIMDTHNATTATSMSEYNGTFVPGEKATIPIEVVNGNALKYKGELVIKK